ncbi:MAG TPA: hypothetical protein VEQ16_05500 [Acidocella sp.]|jgi:hypothetical protein|nr:hypothetical protein [Acidocella sp.]
MQTSGCAALPSRDDLWRINNILSIDKYIYFWAHAEILANFLSICRNFKNKSIKQDISWRVFLKPSLAARRAAFAATSGRFIC